MQDMPSGSSKPWLNCPAKSRWYGLCSQFFAGRLGLAIPVLLAIVLAVETYQQLHQPKRFTSIELEQVWQLEPGDRIYNYPVSSSLGDVVIELGGAALYMPMAGEVEPISSTCSLFASPELPAYRLRLCGLNWVKSGALSQGEILGRGDRVALALLRRQPQGTWAMVEPATSILEQFVTPPSP